METVNEDTGEILEGRHVRPFAEWMHDQRKGSLASELAEGLNTLVDAVNVHHRGGTLTLKVTVKPASNGDGMVMVTDEVTVKPPEAERPAVIYFVDGDANLSRANPAQPELPLREVPRPAAVTTKPEEATAQ